MASTMAVPLLASALLGFLAPWLARRLPPPTAVRLLTASSYVVTGALWYVLSVIGLLVLAHISLLADIGHYSTKVIGSGLPLPIGLAALAPLLLCGLMVAALCRVVLGVRDLT